jgi:hypothetical protein
MQKFRLTHDTARNCLTPETFAGSDQRAAIEAGVITQALASISIAVIAPTRAANRAFIRSV